MTKTVAEYELAKKEYLLMWDFTIKTSEALALMRGKTFTKVDGVKGSPEILFETAEGERFIFGHVQDCCENVSVEDIVGDLSDLIGEPLLIAEEVSSEGAEPPEGFEPDWGSYTWTFYKFATRKGYVDIRWLGDSNGYYSERVDVFHVIPNEEQQ